MRLATLAVLTAILTPLAACGSEDAAENSGVTAEEAAALNDTENMLDVSPDSLAAPEDAPLGNGEMPVEEGATGELPVTSNDAVGE